MSLPCSILRRSPKPFVQFLTGDRMKATHVESAIHQIQRCSAISLIPWVCLDLFGR